MLSEALFTSTKQTWKTPRLLRQALDREFHFDFDPCPADPEFDGLNIAWGRTNFVNPPYNQVEAWIRKSFAEFQDGKTVVILVPARTDTKWFHEICLNYATEIRFVPRRLRFDDHKDTAPFPSMLVIFDNKTKTL